MNRGGRNDGIGFEIILMRDGTSVLVQSSAQGRTDVSYLTLDWREGSTLKIRTLYLPLLFTTTARWRWPKASQVVERILAIAPAWLVARIQGGQVDFWWKGDTTFLESLSTATPTGKCMDARRNTAHYVRRSCVGDHKAA